jgi:MFS family permease
MDKSEEELQYSDQQKKRGRHFFLLFSLVNTVAFNFLAGNVIVLFFIRLEVNNTILGMVSSFMFLSYLFMPLGKMLAHKWGVVKVFGRFWMARFLSISPLVFVPLIAGANRVLAVWLALGAFLLFQTLRGFGIVGYSPVMRALSAGNDRGRFMGLSRIVMNLGMLITSLMVALLLSGDPPLSRFQLFFAVGSALGVLGSLLLFRVPEPPSVNTLKPVPLFTSLSEVLADPLLRRFFTALIVITLALGITRPFMLIHVKRVYLLNDNHTILLTIAGGVGSIVGSLLSHRFSDRYGARPMMLFFLSQIVLVALAVILVPGQLLLPRGLLFWTYVILFFFIGTMGYFTVQHISQVYLFGALSSRQQLNMGILYFLGQGIAGMAGGTFGGLLADLLEGGLGLRVAVSHRLVFLVAGLLALTGLFLVRSWRELDAWSFRGALADLGREMLKKGFFWGRAPR